MHVEKMINGKQCTILWHADDNKISHVDPKVNDAINEEIKKNSNLIVARRENVFVGMNIDIRDNCKTQSEIKDQIKEAIDAFSEDLSMPTPNPAGNNLNKQRPKSTSLEKTKE